jgi:hypothetical protein
MRRSLWLTTIGLLLAAWAIDSTALSPVAEAGVGQLTLAWADNATNEDGFKVERAPGSCTPTPGTFTVLAPALPPNTVGYIDAGLAPGTTFCYRILAFNAAGNSAYSNNANGTTTAIPGAPGTLQISRLDGVDLIPLDDAWQYIEGTVAWAPTSPDAS